MAVLKNKRDIAECEYERTFKALYRTIVDSISKIAKRKQKWLCKDIYKNLNSALNDILSLTDDYFSKDTAKEEKYCLIQHSIECLSNLEKPFMVLWNIEKYPEDKMRLWSALVEKEVSLLNNKIQGVNVVVHMNKIIPINWKRVNDASFLKNMSMLHKVVHSKAIHIPNTYDDSDTSFLIGCIDDVWYNLLKANEKIPKTKDEYEKRRKLISNSISGLKKIQRPLVLFFNIMQYSENTMKSITTMVNDEIKMLTCLQKSDKERFSNLK